MLKKLIKLFLLLIVINGGCQPFIPKGTPPDSTIINIKIARDNLTYSQAVDYLATSLSSYLLMNPIENFEVKLLNNVAQEQNIACLVCAKVQNFNSLQITNEVKDYTILTQIVKQDNKKYIVMRLEKIENDKNSKVLLWEEQVGLL